MVKNRLGESKARSMPHLNERRQRYRPNDVTSDPARLNCDHVVKCVMDEREPEKVYLQKQGLMKHLINETRGMSPDGKRMSSQGHGSNGTKRTAGYQTPQKNGADPARTERAKPNALIRNLG